VELELIAEIRNTTSDGVFWHGVNRIIVRVGYLFKILCFLGRAPSGITN